MTAELPLPDCSLLTPDDIVREVKHLPSAPKVLPRLKELLCDGNSAMHEIVAFIRLDPGIAVRVLQMANSAYFSKGVRCLTVEEAVNRVGYDQVYELVSYAVASQVLVRPMEVYGVEADDLWKMSVSCALSAEALAALTGQDRSVAYTIGLLHCVGMVAIDEWALRNRRGLVLRTAGYPREAVESERAELGFTQAEAGEALLKHWEFPTTISEPVRWQYAPRASAGQMRMSCLLHAAKWLRTAVCAPSGVPRPPLPVESQLQPLGLPLTALGEIANEIAVRLTEVSTLLEVKTGVAVDRPQFPAQSWRE